MKIRLSISIEEETFSKLLAAKCKTRSDLVEKAILKYLEVEG